MRTYAQKACCTGATRACTGANLVCPGASDFWETLSVICANLTSVHGALVCKSRTALLVFLGMAMVCQTCGLHAGRLSPNGRKSPSTNKALSEYHGCKPRVPQTTGLEIPKHRPKDAGTSRPVLCVNPHKLGRMSLSGTSNGVGRKGFP